MADYSKMTGDEFDDLLDEIVYEHGLTYLYGLDGIYEIASEHFNNEVLSRWESLHPELANPEKEESDE